MDCQTTLNELLRELSTGGKDIDRVCDLLDALHTWCVMGGFPPRVTMIDVDGCPHAMFHVPLSVPVSDKFDKLALQHFGE